MNATMARRERLSRFVDLARMCVSLRRRGPCDREVKILDLDAETAALLATCLDRYRKLEGRMTNVM